MRLFVTWMCLLVCTTALHAVDLAWPADFTGNEAPTHWEWKVADGTTQQFNNGVLSITGPLAKYQALFRSLDIDGNDHKPLVISALINSEQQREIGGIPTFIALYWNPTNAILIGLGGMSEGVERYEPWRRRGWAWSIVDGNIESRATDHQLYSGEAPAHVRLLVTGNDVSAAISKDGITYKTLISLPRRDNLFSKPPGYVVVGRGWFGDDAEKRQPLLANNALDPGHSTPVTFTIRQLRISNDVPALPRARIVQKATGFEEIRQADLDQTTVDDWHLLGPLPATDKEYGPERTIDTTNGFPIIAGHDLVWNPVVGEGPQSRRSINLKTQIPIKNDGEVAYAITTIRCEEPHIERFLFDGAKAIDIYVNGRLVADKRWGYETDIVPDRYAATVWLNRGENIVVLHLTSAWGGNCRFSFRHDAASPLQRVADLTYAINTFSNDTENIVRASQEISTWYEALGQRHLAADILGQALDSDELTGQQVDALSFARARLYRSLRDETKLIETIDALAKRRQASDDGNSPTTQLNLVRLWKTMGFPDRATTLCKKLLASEQLDTVTLTEAGFELARLALITKQQDNIPEILRGVAERLPETHELRFPLLLQAMVRDPQHDTTAVTACAGQNAQQLALLYALQAQQASREAKNDQRLTALTHLQKYYNSETPWESILVELAELSAANNNIPGAIIYYQQACAAQIGAQHALAMDAIKKAKETTDTNAISAWRYAYAITCLVDSPAGERLLAIANKAPTKKETNPLFSPVITDWHVIGPFPNDNWQAYQKPPVSFRHIRLDSGAGDLRWSRPGADAYRDNILDLARLYHKENCVAFTYRTFSANAGEGELEIGADDGLVVWFNRELVHEDRENRSVLPGQIKIPVRFKAGTNELLCMVQQGNGEWGLHVRINGAHDDDAIANILRAYNSTASRERLATAIREVITTEISANRLEAATALARLATRSLADQPQVIIPLMNWLISEERDLAPVLTDAKPAIRWLLAMSQRTITPQWDEYIRQLPDRAARLLLQNGDPAGAVAVLEYYIGTTLSAPLHGELLVALGDVYRLAGYPHRAAFYYRRVMNRPDAASDLVSKAKDGFLSVRGARADTATFATSLDAETLVATGDRALAADDAKRAIRSYQRALDQYSSALVAQENGRVVGVPALVGEKLRSLTAEAATTYRAYVDRRAQEALQRAGSNIFLLQDVAFTYPATSAAAMAYEKIGDALLMNGAGSHAAAILAQLAAPNDSALAAQLAAKRAYAIELSGDKNAALAALDLLAKDYASASLTVRGRSQSMADFVAERRAVINANKNNDNWTTTGGSAQRLNHAATIPPCNALKFVATLPVALSDRVERLRFASSSYQHIAMQPIVHDGISYVDTGKEIIAIKLQDGAVLWRSGSHVSSALTSTITREFSGHADRTITFASGLIISRVLQHDAYVIEARHAQTGALIWASATSLGAVNAISPPAVADDLVYAVFQDRDQRYHNTLAAFDVRTGQVRWRTPLGDGVGNLVLSTQQEIALGNHLAAPAVFGGVVYVATDMGGIVALEALTGRINWVSHYPRARLDPNGSKALIRHLANRAPRIMVDNNAVYIAPRDSLALLAFRRSDGAVLWRHPLSDCSVLYGCTTDGLIYVGDGITCVSRRDGSTQWQWRPVQETSYFGCGLVNDEQLVISTSHGMTTLATRDGRHMATRPWADFGLEQPVSNFIAANNQLIGVSETQFALFDNGASTLKPITIADVTQPTLPVSGLPSLPFTAPIAAHWFMAATGDATIHRHGAVTCLDLGNRLVRIAEDGSRIIWSVDQTSELQALIVNDGVLLAVHERYLIARNPDNGAVLWTQPVIWDDFGFTLDSDERKRRASERPIIDADRGTVLIRSAKSGLIIVTDATQGKQLGRFTIVGQLLWCGLAHGKIFSIRQYLANYIFEQRSFDGTLLWSETVEAHTNSLKNVATTCDEKRSLLFVSSEQQMCAINLENPAVAWSRAGDFGERISLAMMGSQLTAFARHDRKDWILQFIDPKDGKQVGQFIHPGSDRSSDLSRPLFINGQLLTIAPSKKRDSWRITCHNQKLEESWSIDLETSNRQRLIGAAAINEVLVLISFDLSTQTCSWQTITLSKGQVTGAGPLAGLRADNYDKNISMAVVGNTMLCAANNSVVGLAAIPASPPSQDPVTAAIALARHTVAARMNQDSFLALYAAPVAPALKTSSALTVDGLLHDWPTDASIQLTLSHNNTQKNSGENDDDLSAHMGVQWDDTMVYVGFAVKDYRFQPPVYGADNRSGDCVVIGIDPERSDYGKSRPLIVAVALVNGKTNLQIIQNRSLATNDENANDESQSINARMVRQGHGYTGEIAIPWSMLRPDPRERPGYKPDLGLSLSVIDCDLQSRKQLTWGAGLDDHSDAQRFGTITCIDLTGDRISGYRKFIKELPDHPFAWRFNQRIAATNLGESQLPARIAEVEGFVKHAPHVPNTAAALAELVRLHRIAGSSDPIAAVAQFAKMAAVDAITLGDGIGPQQDGQGRAIRQWVWIDPENPPLELMVQMHSKQHSYNHRAYWGRDLINQGERNTKERWHMGTLPTPGTWAALIIPVDAIGLNEVECDNMTFSSYSGHVRWGATEYLENGNVQLLIDPAKKLVFDRPTNQEQHQGRHCHSIKKHSGEAHYHLKQNSFLINLLSKAEPLSREQLTTYAQAAHYIAADDEAFDMLRAAEALCDGEERDTKLIALYQSFLAANPTTPQAGRILDHLRANLEGWTNGRDAARRVAAIAQVEKLMDTVQLPREARRQFHASYANRLTDWQALGFFDPGRGIRNLAETIAHERKALDLSAIYRVADGRDVRWVPITGDSRGMNPGRFLTGAVRQRYPIAYMATRIELPDDVDAYLYLGLRGHGAVYVNGKQIATALGGDIDLQADTIVVPCKLKQGLNDIMLKLAERDGNPQVTCRVADINGKPLDGLMSRLPPSITRMTVDSPTRVTLTFNTIMDPTTAGNVAHYNLDRDAMISSATLNKDKKTITLSVSPLTGNSDYYLRLDDITNYLGTAINPGTRIAIHPPGADGNGLRGDYFVGRDFREKVAGRIDPVIDFTWADDESADPALPPTEFSVRWTGTVNPPTTGNWTFTAIADDGVRLWVDGKQLIDNWIDQAPTEISGTIEVKKPRPLDIRLEYYQGGGSKQLQLFWSSDNTARVIIPSDRFTPIESSDKKKK